MRNDVVANLARLLHMTKCERAMRVYKHMIVLQIKKHPQP